MMKLTFSRRHVAFDLEEGSEVRVTHGSQLM
jgi:hypothetical protein